MDSDSTGGRRRFGFWRAIVEASVECVVQEWLGFTIAVAVIAATAVVVYVLR